MIDSSIQRFAAPNFNFVILSLFQGEGVPHHTITLAVVAEAHLLGVLHV